MLQDSEGHLHAVHYTLQVPLSAEEVTQGDACTAMRLATVNCHSHKQEQSNYMQQPVGG